MTFESWIPKWFIRCPNCGLFNPDWCGGDKNMKELDDHFFVEYHLSYKICKKCGLIFPTEQGSHVSIGRPHIPSAPPFTHFSKQSEFIFKEQES